MAALKKRAHDRKQASLLQLKSLKLIPVEAKKAIDAFLQQDPEEGVIGAAPVQPRRGDEPGTPGSLQGHDGWWLQFG